MKRIPVSYTHLDVYKRQHTLMANAQGIVIGLYFANGLSPVTGVYGWLAGVVFGLIHYTFVTCVPLLHLSLIHI